MALEIKIEKGDTFKAYGQKYIVARIIRDNIFGTPIGAVGVAKKFREWDIREINGVKVNR